MREKMSELRKELEERLKNIPEYISVTELPSRIIARIVKHQWKADKRGNEALFVTLETKEGKYVVQKYTVSTYRSLMEHLDKLGFDKLVKEQAWAEWEQKRLGRSINPRLYPIRLVE